MGKRKGQHLLQLPIFMGDYGKHAIAPKNYVLQRTCKTTACMRRSICPAQVGLGLLTYRVMGEMPRGGGGGGRGG